MNDISKHANDIKEDIFKLFNVCKNSDESFSLLEIYNETCEIQEGLKAVSPNLHHLLRKRLNEFDSALSGIRTKNINHIADEAIPETDQPN